MTSQASSKNPSGDIQKLTASLHAANQPTFTLAGHSGHLLIAQSGARAIACEFSQFPGNLFFHPPALEDAASAGSQAAQALQGSPCAGDRLWIAPEVNYIFKDVNKVMAGSTDCSLTPPDMEPGKYRLVSQSARHVTLAADMRLEDRLAPKSYLSLAVSRTYELLDAPRGIDPGLTHFGFALTNSLAITAFDKPGVIVGVWDLLQIPPAGWLVCPTVGLATKPRSYYDKLTDDRVRQVGGAVHFKIDGQGRYKIGLSPTQTSGRMGYYRKLGRLSTLLVRHFAVQPGLTYCDQPVTELGKPIFGDALQSYNGSGFGEMEYHDPALKTGDQPASRAATSVTHAFIGPDDLIHTAAEHLLGVDLPDEL
jgi:hypothetical protein